MAEMGSPLAKEKSDFILLYYPTSDYAGFIRDPEYFVKKKEREKINQDEYMSYLDRFERGLYGVVIAKASDVIQNEKQNAFRSKYMLLRTMSQAKLTEDKKSLVPYLDTLIAEYPDSPEGKRALEMRRIILTGYSKNEAIDFTKKSPFTYSETEPMYALVFLDEKVNLTIAKTRVIDFNKEFFGKYKLVTNSKAYGKEMKNVLTIKELPNPEIAQKYISSYKSTKKHLVDMSKFKIIVISETNMKVLFEKFNLSDYELFYDENY
jgi:sulfur relay (sulfurtransferase) DsrC/TusE family protein